jgi:RNA polymerase sigma factor (sigma-70 family)
VAQARTDPREIDNLGGWLTTVMARLCLDTLRARKVRNDLPPKADPVVPLASADDLERDAQLAQATGQALVVVLDTLAPAERVCFVLHDVFNLSFEEIAAIVNRSPAAARQIASRARRRVQGPHKPDPDLKRQREVVTAFRAAARNGDLAALIALLDPAVVMRADAAAVAFNRSRQAEGAANVSAETHGATAVASFFEGRARAAQVGLIDGAPGLIFVANGEARGVCECVIEADRIVEINLIGDSETVKTLQLSFEQ